MHKIVLQDLQTELTELQTYLKTLASAHLADPIALTLTGYANTIGTVRILLDVFGDEWAESVRKGQPRVDSPGRTSDTCNDFD